MEKRISILFILDGQIVLEEKKDLNIEEIEAMKKIISEECSCKVEDITVENSKPIKDFSDIDVTNEGMFNWLDFETRIFSGVKLNLIEGSDEHLEAINNGTLEKFLEFN